MKRSTKSTTKKVKRAVRKEPVRKEPAKKVTVEPSSQKSLKKQYLKTHPSCKVTFKLPKDAAPEAEAVTVVGDFNDWNITETPMKKLKSGDFSVTVALPCNREYRFRYLVDTNKWENDWFADKYVPNEYGEDDSVVIIESNGC